MTSRADELELYVASDDHYGGVVDSNGKYAPCDEFADRDLAQEIIRDLESDLVRLEKERANDIEESIAEGVDVGRSERDQLKRERDEARRELCAAEYANVFVDVRGPLRTLLRQTAETRWPGTGAGAALFPEEES